MSETPAAHSATALIIEDDDDIRRLLEMTLQQAGLQVETASNGQEGLDRSRNTAYTMVTVDLGLPDMNGLEVVRNLRAWFTGSVVVISARSTESDRQAGIAAGADLFLTKPFRPRQLREQVATLLHTR